MGERKGQNLYYPPDYDPKVGGLNKFLGTHALRERARKLHMGILIIRFEMPYNIWCDGCKNHIGMGVRYNAEKTKIGMYYSTPVYQFRMKCHLCDNHFEIKTDPGNLDYVIVSGARRQENRWDPTENGQIVPDTKETQKRLFDDAMFKLEHKTGDASGANLEKPRLGKLVGRNEVVWKDDYEANCTLRRNFRKRRKELEDSAVNDSLLLARSSLDIHLLPETEEDRNMASLLALKPSRSIEEKQNVTRHKILHSPALPSSSGSTGFGLSKKEGYVHKSRPLSRNALGITIKNKGQTKLDTNSNINADVKQDKSGEGNNAENKAIQCKTINEIATNALCTDNVYKIDNNIIRSVKSGDDIGINEDENDSREHKAEKKCIEPIVNGNVNEMYLSPTDKLIDDEKVFESKITKKVENLQSTGKKTGIISLVGDYSSSGENSE